MATDTRTTTPSRTPLLVTESLPGGLALLGGLNHVARALVPFDPGGTSLAQVVLGVKRILRSDGTAI
ncbi:MAG TPA: hypothetical protein VFR25_08655, partial [Candidatus Eisenbacteria bacterium]|nr:hypothetical protein [Candidatus Eisenbacteria bacterium]